MTRSILYFARTAILIIMVELTDGVLLLRPFTLENADAQLAGEDESSEKWLSGGKSTLESVRNWIKKNQTYWENDGPVFTFAIFTIEGTQVGMIEANCDFPSIEGLREGDANISYGIYPFARGKGYAARAVTLIEEFLKTKGIQRAVIRINPENKNSLHVPKRCEFVEHEILTTVGGEKLTIFIKTLE